MFASARNISCVAPRCVQVQRTLTSPPPTHPTHTKDVTCHVRVCKCKKHQLRSTEMFASARNISCVAPRCVQVQRTLTSPPPPTHPTHTKDVTCHVRVCKCKKHQLRSTEMFASARNISCVAPRCVQVLRTLTSPPPHPPHPYQRRDVPRACVQVQETSVAQYRDVCKCKKHQLRSTEMCASATYVNIPPPPHPPHPYQRRDVPRACVQVQETSVAQYRDVCKCKKHQLRSTEMCASATYVNIPPPTHPTHTKDVTCHVRVCKCKKHQLRSTEMFASARNISCVAPRCVQVQRTLTSPPPPTPPTPPIPKNPLT